MDITVDMDNFFSLASTAYELSTYTAPETLLNRLFEFYSRNVDEIGKNARYNGIPLQFFKDLCKQRSFFKDFRN